MSNYGEYSAHEESSAEKNVKFLASGAVGQPFVFGISPRSKLERPAVSEHIIYIAVVD